MLWRLRRAVPFDADALSLVASATFLEAFAGILPKTDILAHCRTRNAPTAFEEWTRDLGSIVTLVEHASGEAPLGYTVLTAPDLPIVPVPGDVELRRIYSMTAYLGSGLGRSLMDQAVQDAITLDGRRMLLGVYAGNHRARRFYEREGFEVIGKRRFLVGSTWCDDLICGRRL